MQADFSYTHAMHHRRATSLLAPKKGMTSHDMTLLLQIAASTSINFRPGQVKKKWPQSVTLGSKNFFLNTSFILFARYSAQNKATVAIFGEQL